MAPIFVDPSVANPIPPEVIVSPDGVLTAMIHPDTGAVFLEANFTMIDLVPAWVRFERDDRPIRGGNPAASPGGYALGYDMYAPLGVPVTYRAIALDRDESEIGRSEGVSIVLPRPPKWGSKHRVIWLKSVLSPADSMRVLGVGKVVEMAREGRLSLQNVPGAVLPAGSTDIQTSWTFSLEFLTEDEPEMDRMERLLESGTMLLQTPADWQLRDLWVEPNGFTCTPHARMDTGAHRWVVELVEVAEPSTIDTPMIIPGRSWGEIADTYTWGTLNATFDSWRAVLTP